LSDGLAASLDLNADKDGSIPEVLILIDFERL